MIAVKSTYQLDGATQGEYEKIVAYFETYGHEAAGYTLIKEPLIHRVTAVKIEQHENL